LSLIFCFFPILTDRIPDFFDSPAKSAHQSPHTKILNSPRSCLVIDFSSDASRLPPVSFEASSLGSRYFILSSPMLHCKFGFAPSIVLFDIVEPIAHLQEYVSGLPSEESCYGRHQKFTSIRIASGALLWQPEPRGDSHCGRFDDSFAIF
jgi:hypothetical protein